MCVRSSLAADERLNIGLAGVCDVYLAEQPVKLVIGTNTQDSSDSNKITIVVSRYPAHVLANINMECIP